MSQPYTGRHRPPTRAARRAQEGRRLPRALSPGYALPTAAAATLVLGAIGTGYAYTLQFDIVRAAGTVVSSTVTYVIPVVSVLLGVLVLGEHLDLPQLVGFALVLGAASIIGRPAGGWRSVGRRS